MLSAYVFFWGLIICMIAINKGFIICMIAIMHPQYMFFGGGSISCNNAYMFFGGIIICMIAIICIHK
jgi:hypothetical protein